MKTKIIQNKVTDRSFLLNSFSVLVFLFLLFLTPGGLKAVVKTSVSNGNWSSSSNWSPSGVPASGDKIKIYHNITLDQNFTANDTIFVYNLLNLNSNRVLTLNPGTMILVNTATYEGRLGTVATGANIVGNFTFQKWITRCDGFSTYGSPFTVPANDFNWYYCNQCMPSWSNVYYYDETQPGVFDVGYYDNYGSNISRGKGFFYWYSNYNGGLNFPRQISLKGSITFTTDFDFNVTRTSSMGSSHDGFNLISNPFPGTIDWSSTEWTKRRIANAVYVWNDCTNSYATYSSGVGVNGGGRYIPSMQGFWVQARGSNPQLKIKSGAMTTNARALLRTESPDSIKNILRITLNDDEIAIRLDANSTSSMDTLTDAVKFYSDGAMISSGVKSDSTDYSINSVEEGNQVIPLKTKTGGTLSFSGINSFYGLYTLYLNDKVNKTYQPITEGMQYVFSDTTTVTFQKRFEIYFYKNETTGIVKNQLQESSLILYDQETVNITLAPGSELPVKITMYDLLGREVYSGNFDQNDISVPKYNGPVIINVRNNSSSFSKRIF